MEEKKNPERLDYTKEEYKTERKRGTIFAFLGLILINKQDEKTHGLNRVDDSPQNQFSFRKCRQFS